MSGPIDSASRRTISHPDDASFDQGFSRKDGTVGKSDSSGRVDSGQRLGAACGSVNQSVSSDGVGKDALVQAALRRARQNTKLPTQQLRPVKAAVTVDARGGGVEAKAKGDNLRGRVTLGDVTQSHPSIPLKVPHVSAEVHYESKGETMGLEFELSKMGLGVTVSAKDTDGDGKADVTAFKWELGPLTLTHQGRHVEGQAPSPEHGARGNSAKNEGAGGSAGQ